MRRFCLIATVLLSLSSRLSATTYLVLNTNDSGAGSFRQALADADNHPGLDVIQFNLPGPAPYTIALSNALSAIDDPVIIDAASQPGFSGRPVIELAGNKAGTNNIHGLHLAAGGSTVRGLAINRFSGYGIYIDAVGGNTIEGSFIGCDVTGSASLPNGQGAIGLIDSPDNVIGGLASGARNVLSGRNRVGIFISGNNATHNQVLGNFIGTDTTGLASLGSAFNGVLISEAPFNIIGGTVPAARNIISANGQSGVYILGAGSFSNVVQGNFIGPDISGSRSLSNVAGGITISAASSNLIGGAVAGARNIISGNGQYGIYISGGSATANLVQGNFVGASASGSNALANAYSGIGLDSVTGNVIGGTTPGARNVLSGNAESGLEIFGGASNIVQGNFIGADVSGMSALSNAYNGVTITTSHANLIGGATSGAGNLLSGNGVYGVYITGSDLPGNVLQGNFMGTDISGHSALPNLGAGVGIIGAPGNLIGGTNAGAGNLFSGNSVDGLYLTNSSGNTIQGNFVGTDVSGTEHLGNLFVGLFVSGSQSNLIGGTTPGARNLISDNDDVGVYLLRSSNNVVEGNFIGTDVSGTSSLGNFDGVLIQNGSSNRIGGAALGAGNLICGSSDTGVYLLGASATANKVQGNFIGTAPDGAAPLPNHGHGVQLDLAASLNFIGGLVPNEGNLIAYNTLDLYAGVRIQPANGSNQSTNNLIAGNSILGHRGIGIDLQVNGVTLNDSGDNDKGANNQQNFPVLSLASNSPGQTVIQGTLNSDKSKSYRLEFFASPTCSASGSGEGQTFLAALSVVTDINNNAAFTNTIPWAVPAGFVITATATDPANNTSEFSACRTVIGASISSDLRVTATATPNPVSLGDLLAWQITVQNLGPNPAFGVKLVEILPAGAEFVSANPSPAFRFGDTFTFNLGALPNGMSLVVSLVVRPALLGPLTNRVSIGSAVPDPALVNNQALTIALVEGPSLSIGRADGTVVISWPVTSIPFQLESADSLPSSKWASVSSPPARNAGRQSVILGIQATQKFYRLRKL